MNFATPTGERFKVIIEDARVRRLVLMAILLLAVGRYLVLITHWNSVQPNSAARLAGDEPGYDNIARELLAGWGFTWPGRVPLYPLWLAGVYMLTGGSYAAVPYAQMLLSLVMVLLTFWLGRRQFGPGVGLLAALLAVLSYPLAHQSLRLLSEVLYTPLILAVTLAHCRAMDQPAGRNFAALGGLIGLSNLARPTLLLFPLFFLPVCWWLWGRRRGLRYSLITLAVSLLVVMPWIIHNTVIYKTLFPLQTSNALLWQGSPEYYHLVRDEGYTYARVWSEVLYGPGWQERDPNSIDGDRYWTRRALASIAGEPLLYLRFAGEKVFTYWVGDPNADWGDTYVFNYSALRAARIAPHIAIQIMAARMLPLVAAVALVALRRQWARLRPIVIIVVYFTALHAATHAEVRLSEPLLPLVLVIIAAALARLTSAWFRRLDTGGPTLTPSEERGQNPG